MKKMVFPAVILMILLLPGCWDYEEYEDMALVHSIGFDSGPGPDEVTVTISTDSASASSGQAQAGGAGAGENSAAPPESIYSAYSTAIGGAIDKISTLMNRTPFLGYTRVIVLGNTIGERDLKKVVSYLDISPFARGTMNLAVAEGKAKDVLNTYDPQANEMSGVKIFQMINTAQRSGEAFPIRLTEFNRNLYADGIEPVLPVIAAERTGEEAGKTASDPPAGSSSAYELFPLKAYDKVEGIAVFKGYKIVGFLNGEESRGLGWVLNKRNTSSITASCQVLGRNSSIPVTFSIKSAATRIKVKLIKGSPEIFLDSRVRAYVENVPEEGIQMEPENVKAFEKGLADAVQSDMGAAVSKAQKELKSDVFGFGRQFFIQHRHEWTDKYKNIWDGYFQSVPVHISVNVTVLDTGKVIKSLEQFP